MTNTRTFTVVELDDDLVIAPWSKNVLANIEGEPHRWYTVRHLVFEHEGKFWQVEYMDPSTEMQEGQARWDYDTDDAPEGIVTATEVEKVPVITHEWKPVGTHQVDDAAWHVIDRIIDGLRDLDDGDTPFGCFADTKSIGRGAVQIAPDPDPENWDDGVAPETPVVLVVAQRIK